ncbi:hypothetical protein [Algoriphagus formosus]|jgi:hypothetical protein|uniref:Uncharacterized protein n=1 Tax=Algoriphagus formosus TaxID=2007308 RepID=A0A4R5VE18_9BACT|nr:MULTISPECIES: hypothetical protein [Algoriphagus]TDK50621.1 hypothetical protein E1898_00855 [Algoriphagus aquimaris]
MTLIIRQLVIRGEVIPDSGQFDRKKEVSLEEIRDLINQAKREMERELEEKFSQVIDYSATR